MIYQNSFFRRVVEVDEKKQGQQPELSKGIMVVFFILIVFIVIFVLSGLWSGEVKDNDFMMFLATVFGGAGAAYFASYAASQIAYKGSIENAELAGKLAKEAAIEGARKAAEIELCAKRIEDLNRAKAILTALFLTLDNMKKFALQNPEKNAQLDLLLKYNIRDFSALLEKNILNQKEKNFVIKVLAFIDLATKYLVQNQNMTNKNFMEHLQSNYKELNDSLYGGNVVEEEKQLFDIVMRRINESTNKLYEQIGIQIGE